MSYFSLLIGLGASFGLLRIIQRPPTPSILRWLTAGLITLFGAMIGARLGFAAAYDSYFKIFPAEIIQITKGGLSWPGAVIGAGVFALLALKLLKIPFWSGLDHLARMLLPISVAVWLGAWQAGIAYGSAVSSDTWWALNMTDSSGLTTFRVPVQPAAVLSLILMLILGEWLGRKPSKPGMQIARLATLFSIHSLLFSFFRVDPVQEVFGLRLDTWASLFFCIASLVLILMVMKQKKPIGSPAAVKLEIENEIEPCTGAN